MIDGATRAAERAGALLMERFGRLLNADIERIGRRDVVTTADRTAEALLVRELERVAPGVPVWSEEGRRDQPQDRPEGVVWIVDPLDGTVNFIQGIAIFAVSVALVEDGVPQLGVVHLPALSQTFVGAPGNGAFENGRPISVSVTPFLEDAIVATGFAYARDDVPDDNLDNVVTLGRRARGLRRMGAAAVDLAYVASGRLDAFWELHLSPWDVAGGAALVRAAGGRITDMRGGEDWLFGGHIVASNGMLHDPLRTALAPLQGL